ncbi:hypothetical protein P344_05445 [Spiroplasma mirum ATCC 29335]|uniref:Uncharacterized protein n=1 Tax=Spiroplasma mirum ATCC 29335 TaxID=838561 RepID=W0GRN8_9MOLU|nr:MULTISPECIES: Gfo/Idh/MocA family oxidoreductase [Spiroplasma]AHF61304.1 putative oxidoreductase [Spiroplasma mirum ATCC 29335]AHI58409.1 hypothetical protein P344_05445 [Spiroplasma mirum ATCC 29335]AKM53359.1 oxioreductase [Spiroplasma atrichopogonis]
MLRFGIIGTGNIATEFIDAARQIKDIELSCLYSRSMEKAKIFSLKNNLQVRMTTTFEDMLDHIDAIYIASPNGLHYQQAKYFLQQQKHVFLEKPLAFSAHEARDLEQVALVNNVILMEAFKPIHLPEYEVLSENVNKIKPFIASFHWNKYSSRMKEVLIDEYHSVFDENLGKGSLYDALIYPMELAIALFGKVKEVKAMSHKLKNNVDINNVVVMRHENDIITNIVCSKAATGISKSEILSYDYTITFDHLTMLSNLAIYDRFQDQTTQLFTEEGNKNKIVYELKKFINIIKVNNINEMRRLLDLTIEAIRVLELVNINE